MSLSLLFGMVLMGWYGDFVVVFLNGGGGVLGGGGDYGGYDMGGFDLMNLVMMGGIGGLMSLLLGGGFF